MRGGPLGGELAGVRNSLQFSSVSTAGEEIVRENRAKDERKEMLARYLRSSTNSGGRTCTFSSGGAGEIGYSRSQKSRAGRCSGLSFVFADRSEGWRHHCICSEVTVHKYSIKILQTHTIAPSPLL